MVTTIVQLTVCSFVANVGNCATVYLYEKNKNKCDIFVYTLSITDCLPVIPKNHTSSNKFGEDQNREAQYQDVEITYNCYLNVEGKGKVR